MTQCRIITIDPILIGLWRYINHFTNLLTFLDAAQIIYKFDDAYRA